VTWQRRVDSPRDVAHVSLPRRGRNMRAQGKRPRVLRAIAPPWVTKTNISNSPERAQQAPRTDAAVSRRAAQRGAIDDPPRRCSAFVLVVACPGLRIGSCLVRHLSRPFRAFP
jgi:hypothetical protein